MRRTPLRRNGPGSGKGWRRGFTLSDEHKLKISESRLGKGVYDEERLALSAEKRFAKATTEGLVPEFRPDLGPCLLYTGATNSSGYGQFRYNRRNGYAHRYAWESANGSIPAGMTIDHLCRIRTCVRVAHLEVVDGVTNYLRGAALRDRCRNGHEYPPDSKMSDRGGRRCEKCDRATRQRSEAKRRRLANGLPDRRIRYEQRQVRQLITQIRDAGISISQAAREIGCNPNYLGRRTWEAAKRDVRARDKHLCVSCGAKAVDVQHRIRRGSGGTRDPRIAYGMTNLIALCRSCHDRCEARNDKMHDRGYWLNTWEDPAMVPVTYWDGRVAWLTSTGGLVYEAPAGGEAA